MHQVALEIGCTLDVIKSMPYEDFISWVEFLSWRNEAEKKAYKDASKKRR